MEMTVPSASRLAEGADVGGTETAASAMGRTVALLADTGQVHDLVADPSLDLTLRRRLADDVGDGGVGCAPTRSETKNDACD